MTLLKNRLYLILVSAGTCCILAQHHFSDKVNTTLLENCFYLIFVSAGTCRAARVW